MATITDPASLLAMGAAVFAGIFAVAVLLWVYVSLAFTAISKKASLSSPGLAWIPGVGPQIQAFRAAKMHWWPWILIVLTWIPVLGGILSIVFLVYTIIWTWKLLETINKPGWWSILPVIPIIGTIAYLIVIGIAAWSKN